MKPSLEERYGTVEVREIRCPEHGDVTAELVPPDWDGRATLVLVRQMTIHPGCGCQLLWATVGGTE